MRKLRQTYHIKATVSRVWRALVDPMIIEGWGGGPATMNGRVGTAFELWGGDIRGSNIEVVKEKTLVQDWYGGDWPEPSRVTFAIEPEEGGTRVILVHENIPDAEVDAIRDGWRRFYLGPMKEYLEAS